MKDVKKLEEQRKHIIISIIVFVVTVSIVYYFSNYFGIYTNKEIATSLLVYSGLLTVFYGYNMEKHYEHLHKTNAFPVGEARPFYNRIKLMIIASFIGLISVFGSSILDIFALGTSTWRVCLLHGSIILLSVSSILLIIVLYWIFKGLEEVVSDELTKREKKSKRA